jgi:hypothetical protein
MSDLEHAQKSGYATAPIEVLAQNAEFFFARMSSIV